MVIFVVFLRANRNLRNRVSNPGQTRDSFSETSRRNLWLTQHSVHLIPLGLFPGIKRSWRKATYFHRRNKKKQWSYTSKYPYSFMS
jgi:hypothetical protein